MVSVGSASGVNCKSVRVTVHIKKSSICKVSLVDGHVNNDDQWVTRNRHRTGDAWLQPIDLETGSMVKF